MNRITVSQKACVDAGSAGFGSFGVALFKGFVRCVSLAAILFFWGCISIKDDRAVETEFVKNEIVAQKTEVLVNHGITAKFTPDRGQMLMELFWWNSRRVVTTVKTRKRDVVYKTIRIGFFPGVCTGELMTDTPFLGHLWCLVCNYAFLFTPTVASIVYGSWMEPARPGDFSFPAWGLFGNYLYMDREDPKILREYDVQRVEERDEKEPIRLVDFDVEIDGQTFHGQNGVAYIGAVVGDRTAMDIKVLSFAAPAGLSTNDVLSVCGSSFRAKIPTEGEFAAEAERKRLQEVARMQQIQAESAATAARIAAQQAADQAMIGAAQAVVQGANAFSAAMQQQQQQQQNYQPPVVNKTVILSQPAQQSPTIRQSTFKPYHREVRPPSFYVGTNPDGTMKVSDQSWRDRKR